MGKLWKFLKFLAMSVIIVFMSFGIYKYTNKYDLNMIYENIIWSISAKGCSDAVSFDFDYEDNLYIAFKNYIKKIESNNREEIIIKDESFNIYDIICYKDDIIIATDNRVIKYSLSKEKYYELVNNIPNEGINKETKLLLKDNILYITVGSNTNSGIVEDENGSADKASFEWISSGVLYGDKGTGGFSDYGKGVKEGEKIPESIISNASILEYNLDEGTLGTYATGVRNVGGLAFDSEDKLICIVGGMENYGLRKVVDDVDYIYEIKEKSWYGWPDFSGGDPIKSPRFNEEGYIISYLINNHPTEAPYGPLYQHSSVSSLNGLAIDYDGECLVKNTIIFSDNKENILYALSKKGTARELMDLGDNSRVEKIIYNESNIYVLDSLEGCIYKIQGQGENSLFNLPVIVWIFLILFVLTIIFTIVYKIKNKNIKK